MVQGLKRVFKPILFGSLAALLPVLLAARPASGASRQTEEKAARKACLSGDYSKGVSILADLFVETREPTYVFNQGRCLEQNLRYREAIARFEEYLRMSETMKLEPADQAAAEKHIADCKARLPEDPDRSHAVSPQQLVQPPPAVAISAPETAHKPETSVQTIAQPESPRGRPALLTAGIITAAVGVVGVVGGVVLNLKANSMVDDMENKLGSYSSANVNEQKTYQTLAWVGYGVGAACVVAGAVLIGFGAKSGTRSPTAVALAPAVGPGQVGATLTGGF